MTTDQKRKKIAVLYSGGLDSMILHHYAKVTEPDAEVVCVYWDHGQDAATGEMAHLPPGVKVRKVDWLNLPGIAGGYAEKHGDPSGPIYIPGRNLVFAVLTACLELPDEIWIGALAEESHPHATDKNRTFTALSSELISYVLSPFIGSVTIRAPFVDANMMKIDVVRWGLENGLTPDHYRGTCSCYQSASRREAVTSCGNCKQCLRRFMIFGKLGFDELALMDQHPLVAPHSREWLFDLVTQLEATDWRAPLVLDAELDYLLKYIPAHMSGDEELMALLPRIERGMDKFLEAREK